MQSCHGSSVLVFYCVSFKKERIIIKKKKKNLQQNNNWTKTKPKHQHKQSPKNSSLNSAAWRDTDNPRPVSEGACCLIYLVLHQLQLITWQKLSEDYDPQNTYASDPNSFQCLCIARVLGELKFGPSWCYTCSHQCLVTHQIDCKALLFYKSLLGLLPSHINNLLMVFIIPKASTIGVYDLETVLRGVKNNDDNCVALFLKWHFCCSGTRVLNLVSAPWAVSGPQTKGCYENLKTPATTRSREIHFTPVSA